MIIDGIADLVSALNDELEATRVTSMLLKYTALYNSHISVVIHENKANDYANESEFASEIYARVFKNLEDEY